MLSHFLIIFILAACSCPSIHGAPSAASRQANVSVTNRAVLELIGIVENLIDEVKKGKRNSDDKASLEERVEQRVESYVDSKLSNFSRALKSLRTVLLEDVRLQLNNLNSSVAKITREVDRQSKDKKIAWSFANWYPPTKSCQSPWIRVRPHLCVLMSVDDYVKWEPAKVACETAGGSLATFQDADELKAVRETFGVLNALCPWIGYRWKKGHLFVAADRSDSYMPNVTNKSPNNCLTMCQYQLAGESCHAKRNFICEKRISEKEIDSDTEMSDWYPSSAECIPPWILVKPDLCVLMSSGSDTTWYKGNNICKWDHGSLAIFRSRDEYETVMDRFKGMTANCPWIGLRSIRGNIISEDPKTNYTLNLKLNKAKDECIVGCRTKMSPTRCTYFRNFICERRITPNRSNRLPMSLPNWYPPTKACSPPWIKVRPHLCVVMSASAATWEIAEKTCRKYNSVLATFRNQDEYKAVIGSLRVMVANCPWIGVKLRNQAINYSTDHYSKYRHFTSDSHHSGCVQACKSRMYGVSCSFSLNYVCMKRITT